MAFDIGREHFAACVAHELRAPIALQRALVEVTLADPAADAYTLREMGERVVTSCMRQQRLIEALLDLVQSGRELTRREPVDLAAITDAALRAHDLGGLGSAVALEPVLTAGDPHLLERLVANLVANAIHHNVLGGTIEVATRSRSGRAVLAVANTGRPIAPGDLERLFQPFQRIAPQPHPTDAAQGVGLGLTIVQAIADAHGAFTSARARAGGGLEIQVSFPATAARATGYSATHSITPTQDTTPARTRGPTRTPTPVLQP